MSETRATLGTTISCQGLSSTEPPTIEDRIARGLASGRVSTDEVIPFPAGWGIDLADLGHIRRGPRRAEIYARLNDGWPTRFHRFRSPGGQVIQITLRQDHPTEKKKFILPLRVERLVGIRPDIVVLGLAEPRPLFNLDQLAARQGAPVLFVEGEKSAEAASARFPDVVATTWLNGASGIGAADLRPIRGRDIIIWPDNDAPGRTAANQLALRLSSIGAATVRIVDVPSSFPAKWDLADSLPEMSLGQP